MQERRVDDYWNVDLSRSLSASWKGVTKCTQLKEKPPKGYVVREETDNDSNDYQTRSCMARSLGEDWQTRSESRKKKNGQKKNQSSTNARRLIGTYLIDPDDEEYEEILKNARRNLESPMAAAMPCKKKARTSNKKSGCGGNCIPEGSKDDLWLYSGISLNPQDNEWNVLCLQNTKITS